MLHAYACDHKSSKFGAPPFSQEVGMGETVKATVIGTIIIGIFMLMCTFMVTHTVQDLAHKTRQYVEAQKMEMKHVVLAEKRKAKEVFLEGASLAADAKKK
jgi:hypothetical protein